MTISSEIRNDVPVVGPRRIGVSDVTVHPIALDGSIFGWAAGNAEAASVLDGFVDSGGRFVSTADHYAGGRSEIMIGQWMRARANREAVTISTKVGRHPDAPGHSAFSIRRGVEASLARLQTDHIDFLALDGEHPATPLEETLDTVAELVADGRVSNLAVSQFSPERIRQAQALAHERSVPLVSALFVEYNLMDRSEFERALEPIATELGRGALARLPLASGFLTGDYRSRDDVPDSVMFGGALKHIGKRGSRVLAALESVATELDASLAQVAVAWVLLKPGVAAAVVRARAPHQLAELFHAPFLSLTRSHMSTLDRASE